MANTVLGTHGSGTHAARPAGNAVPDGSLYSCTTHSLIYVSSYGGNSWSTWASLTGTGLSDPMTTRGDIIVRNSSNATDRLGRGVASTVLRSDGTDVGYAHLPGTIIGQAANQAGDQSITSATLADLPTNIPVSFTVPTTGNVEVFLAAVAGGTTTANAFQSWGLRESTSIIAGGVGESIAKRQQNTGASENLMAVRMSFRITGLTPGDAKTYKWAAAASTSGATFKANASIPAVITVVAIP